MFGKIVLLATVAVAFALPKSSLEGVDPNSLSCDPSGQTYLLLPSYDDCTKFYMCAHGEEVEFDCPGGLWFDFVLQGCNWPTATECILRTEGEDQVEGGEGSGEGSGWDEDITERPNGRPRPTRFDDIMLNCADTSSVKLAAHRDNCQRYWRCHNGVAETVYCSDGLYFNPKSLQCDFEANVVCASDVHEEIGEEFIRY